MIYRMRFDIINSGATNRDRFNRMIKNKRLYNFVIVPAVVLIAGFIRSICVEVFTLPYNFAPGVATVIAAMVE